MHTIELWHWRLWDPIRRRHFTSRWRMTEADALALDPQAQRIEHSLERRQVPSSIDEHQHTNAWQRPLQ